LWPWILVVSIFSASARRVDAGNGDRATLRDQLINFLESAVVLLLLTNAVSATAAICAVRLLKLYTGLTQETTIECKLAALLNRGT
jgi:hypothetical protein